MVASLVMGIAAMSAIKSEPAKVDATGSKIVYFHNDAGWSDPKIHAWGGTGATGAWGSTTMIALNGGYYYYDIQECTDFIIYNPSNDGQRITYGSEQSTTIVSNGLYNHNGYTGNTFDLASKVDYTLYFRNESGWSSVYAYLWTGETNNGWPGVRLTAVDGDWYSTDVLINLATDSSFGYTDIIFSDNGDSYKRVQTTLDTSNRYYSNGRWNSGISTALASPDADAYYTVGIHNGKVGWYPSEDSVVIDGANEAFLGDNQAYCANVLLYAGDVFKVKKGDSWFGGSTYNTEGGAVSVSEYQGNITINTTGVYNVYVDNAGEVWLTKVVRETKSKLSVDGENYLLLMTGIQYIEGPNVEVGYSITVKNGGTLVADLSNFTTVYYNAVNLNVSKGESRVTSSTLYGVDYYGLVVEEININDYIGTGYTLTVTAEIRNISTKEVIASGTTLSKDL